MSGGLGAGGKLDQTITFPAIGDQAVTSVVGLAASASSGLAASFATNGGSAVIADGTNLSFTATGVVSIVASQAGDATYNPAPDVTNTFDVTQATAEVYLQSLSQTFDGSPRNVTATTMPAGLTVDITYDGSATAPTNTGSYAVTGTVNDANYQGSAGDTLVINVADQTITFPAIADQLTTNNYPLAATADSGLAVTFAVGSGPGSIAGGTNLTFTAAGAVSIVASQAGDANWNPALDVTNTFNVTQATAEVYLQSLSQTFDGSPRTVTATTMPVGLTVDITYDGGATPPTNAGSYAVTGVVNDVMYQGSAAGTLVVGQAAAGIYLQNLTQVYSGGPKYATVTTMPAGLTVTITYDGGTLAPSNAGTYAVTGTVSALNYQGVTNGILTILQQSQAITFPPIADQLATNKVGLAATAESGLPVSFDVASGPAAIADLTNLSFSGGGWVSIAASQAGDGNWEPASNVTNTFRVFGLYSLTIESGLGTPDPAAGVYTNIEDTVVTNTVTEPAAAGGTQFVCTGWAMTGNEPQSGSTTSFVMTVTNDATLTWGWMTNYWLNTAAGPNGSVNVGDGWQVDGVTTQITATANQYYHFTNWSGDVSLSDISANPLGLLIDSPKAVTANFAENMTTSSPAPVPEIWMAEYGLTNFEEDVNADPDLDGQFTWEEYLAAETDPTNPASYFHADTGPAYGTNYVEVIGEGFTQRSYEVVGMCIGWPSASGRLYDVESAPDVPGYDWTPTEWIDQAATPPVNTITNPAGAMTNAAQFFRAKAQME